VRRALPPPRCCCRRAAAAALLLPPRCCRRAAAAALLLPRDAWVRYGASEESKMHSKTVLSGLFKTDAHKRDSMVRKAADKFKALLKKRGGRSQVSGTHVANSGSTFANQLDDD
jgi:hypothetical protein